jgi:hypothetical protein
MTKATKSEVNYSKGMIHSHCGRVFPNDNGFCKHFKGAGNATKDGICSEVEGPISPIYWCERFDKAKK